MKHCSELLKSARFPRNHEEHMELFKEFLVSLVFVFVCFLVLSDPVVFTKMNEFRAPPIK